MEAWWVRVLGSYHGKLERPLRLLATAESRGGHVHSPEALQRHDERGPVARIRCNAAAVLGRAPLPPIPFFGPGLFVCMCRELTLSA